MHGRTPGRLTRARRAPAPTLAALTLLAGLATAAPAQSAGCDVVAQVVEDGPEEAPVYGSFFRVMEKATPLVLGGGGGDTCGSVDGVGSAGSRILDTVVPAVPAKSRAIKRALRRAARRH